MTIDEVRGVLKSHRARGVIGLLAALALTVAWVPVVPATLVSVSASIVSSSHWTDSAGYMHVVGDVVNNGAQNEQFVEIDATYYNGSNTVIGTDFTFSTLDTLSPGEKSPFMLLFDPSTYPGYDHYVLGPVTAQTAGAPSQLFTTAVTSDTVDISGYEHLVGTVFNRNSTSADYVEPVFTFYGADGSVVDGDFTFINTGSTSTLPPCSSAAFELIRTPDAPSFSTYAVISQSSSAPSLDVSLPTAPTSVTASAGNSSATVTWNPSTADACNPITSYLVTASPGGRTATTSGTSVAVTGLTNGSTYTFTVRANNASGSGPSSAASNAVQPATVPGSPLNVTATAGNLSATIVWSAPVSNGGSAITGYTATSSPGGLTSAVGGSTLATTVSGLALGTTYTFTVVATNTVGPSVASPASNQITAVTLPSAPSAVIATAAGGSAILSWTAPPDGGLPITEYVVTAYVNGVTPLPSVTFHQPNTLEVVIDLTNGVTYTFTITAVNGLGFGPASGPSNSITPDASLRPASAQSSPQSPGARGVNGSSPAPAPPR